MEGLVTTKEHDYLDEDKPIKNQNFCLLSFISPEDVIKNKEAYYIKAFLDKFSKDCSSLLISSTNPFSSEINFPLPTESAFLNKFKLNFYHDSKRRDNQFAVI